MIIRTALAIAALALGVTAVVAQQDPIEARKALMKANGQQAGIGGKMAKGEEPFALDKAKKIFTTYADSATKAPALFPDNSKTGGDTRALPAIWEKKDDFNAKLAKFGADSKAAEAKVTDLESFKTEYAEVQKNCGGCHQPYRRPQN
jgi:cytochrome c556